MRFAVILLVLIFGLQAYAEERIALVIGNSNYTGKGFLENPVKDAEIIAKALEEVGFKVDLHKDLDAKGLKLAIRNHRDKLTAAGSGAISFFYYAGHGANDSQDKHGGTNYMIPIGADMATARDLQLEAVRLSDAIDSYAQAGVSFVVFDACRNYPFPSAQFRSIFRGFAIQPSTKGSYIVFSSEPGSPALDASGFSAALAEAIRTPGLNHRDVFSVVRTKVNQQTGNIQFPWFRDGILGDVYFIKGVTPKPLIRDKSEDELFWEIALQLNKKEAYLGYLKRFPEGKFAKLAQQKINSDEFDKKTPVVPVWIKVTDEHWSTLEADDLVKIVLAATTPEELKIAADKGDADAAALYSKYLTSPNYFQAFDYELARKYDLIAHEGGNLRGTHSLAYHHHMGLSGTVDLEKAKLHYIQACKGGIAISCNNLGTIYQDASSSDQDKLKGTELYQRACTLGSSAACSNLALQYAEGTGGVSKDLSKALEFAKTACHPKDEYNCSVLGEFYRRGWGVEKSYTTAASYQAKSCEKNNPTGCRLLGTMKLNGIGTPKDVSGAFDTFRKACRLNDSWGCFEVASLYRTGENGMKNPAEALSLFKRECEKKNARACHVVGEMYQSGEGTQRSFYDAFRFFRTSCDLELASGCTNAGFIIEKGTDALLNYPKSFRLFKRVCELESAMGCVRAGIASEFGRGVSPSLVEASKYYERAINIEPATKSLSHLFRVGTKMKEKDPLSPGAIEIFKLGCNKGDQRACAALK